MADKVCAVLQGERSVQALRKMLAIRFTEDRLASMYLAKEVAGFCHLYIGQEAVAVGAALAMQDVDTYITSYRAHGFMFLRNDDIEDAAFSLVAELLGRQGGCSGGKGGSMHVFDPVRGFYGGHGIVGAQVSLGTGLALAHKYKGDGGVSLVFMGDGAANQGQVFESFNMAAAWKLPVVYIVENNLYAMGTAVCRASANADFYKRGECFGIRGAKVDGMCLFEVYEAVQRAMDACRASQEPQLLEIVTYRYKGHSMSDPGSYRSRAEVDDYRKNRDPIDRVRRHIIDECIMSADEVKALEKDIALAVDRAVDRARLSPEPAPKELYIDVYGS